MDILLRLNKPISPTQIQICGSKSESNRLLILQKLFPEIAIANLSEAQDTALLEKALNATSKTIDIYQAGTAMRFLTAFFASQEGREVILTGSQRMKERPISILVDALITLGAEITYVEKIGFPPLRIKGKTLTNNKITINANVSSQYISALLLIAPTLKNGLEISLEGKQTSFPYLKMTLDLLKEMGVAYTFKENKININPFKTSIPNKTFTVESDWSSASYFYSIVALSPLGTSLTLATFYKKSLQGDAALAEIYKHFGVETKYQEGSITITKKNNPTNNHLKLDLKNTPDIAQTIAISSFGLGITCELTGLHTLKIKETDRLEALKNELQKLGASCIASTDCFALEQSNFKQKINLSTTTIISTYNDHRMAMAFAPLAVLFPIAIQNAEVVEKSYPAFWKDLKKIGFELKPISKEH